MSWTTRGDWAGGCYNSWILLSLSTWLILQAGSISTPQARNWKNIPDVGLSADQVPTSPYWDDLFPLAAGNGLTATQNIYKDQWSGFRGNETAGLFNLDLGYYPGSPNGETYRYFNPQFVNLVGWTSIGTSSYHALQASLHHPTKNGLQFDFDYTFAKSLDLGSDAERLPSFNSRGFSQIINSFDPKLNKAPSDFDVRHSIAANMIANLPFGQGAYFAHDVNRLTDFFIGHWRLTSLAHWTSGLPWGAIDGLGWSTNFDSLSWVVATGQIQSGGHKRDTGGQPNALTDPATRCRISACPIPVRRDNVTFSAAMDISASIPV